MECPKCVEKMEDQNIDGVAPEMESETYVEGDREYGECLVCPDCKHEIDADEYRDGQEPNWRID